MILKIITAILLFLFSCTSVTIYFLNLVVAWKPIYLIFRVPLRYMFYIGTNEGYRNFMFQELAAILPKDMDKKVYEDFKKSSEEFIYRTDKEEEKEE